MATTASPRSARTKPASPRRARRRKTLTLTAAYLPDPSGGYTVEVLEATGVHTQGDTFDEARANLYEVIALMLEEAPSQFGVRPASAPPGALLEKVFVMLPA